MNLDALKKILSVFVAVKVVQLVIIFFTPCQFDTSSQLLLHQPEYIESKARFIQGTWLPQLTESLVNHIIEKLVIWDVVYFSDMFVNEIKYEHQFVFCPLWWRLIKGITALIYGTSHGQFYQGFVISLMVNGVVNFLNTILLYELTMAVFGNKANGGKFFNVEKLSYYSSLTFILSPASTFLVSSYSEAFCTFWAFGGLYLREKSISYHTFNVKYSIVKPLLYFASGVCFLVGLGFRANSLLLGVIYVYDLYSFTIKQFDQRTASIVITTGATLFVSFLASNIYPYMQFCFSQDCPNWCYNAIPSLFMHAQSHYWNNGFLKYWTANNIPNFLFPLPTIIIHLLSYKLFLFQYPMIKLIPILLVNAVVLIGGIFFWHVQILTRVTSFLPILNWTLSILHLSADPNDSLKFKIFVTYLVLWNVIHPSLFAAFLPPA